MSITYKLLLILFNVFLFIGISISIYEAVDGGYTNEFESLIFSSVGAYAILSSTYFAWKSRKIKKNKIDSAILDLAENEPINGQRFRFAWTTGISNIIFGLLMISTVFYILIFYGFIVNYPIIEELLRLVLLFTVMLYGFLQIYYSVNVLRVLKSNS